MTYLIEIWCFLSTWGAVIGLALDIGGACLVYVGVRTSLAEALRLEAPIVPMTIDDIGGEGMVQRANEASTRRAEERLRAKRWSLVGLAFFLLGFLLQAISSWPKP
ncbi:MAG: hypothetical protein M1392_04370 [Gammaproteobacteria bacterium]|nr:hypothetical protein [Gammaproteobacteria bacterium]